MELKAYQKQVIKDLSDYFSSLEKYQDGAKAFNQFWLEKVGPYNAISGEGMRPYQSNVPEAIHLCIKVPTAGGKTFIACNALKTIFDAMPESKAKAVVWLVPWSNLLDQTVKNLSDPDHPYCQKLNALFNNRVAIYEKSDLIHGKGFNPGSVREQLNIMVMNFASIRAKNKDDRKIFEQNGALASFATTNEDQLHVLEGTDDTSLINVIRKLNPVLIVDESHNAESALSVDMLRNLNPSFILDLTATPKNNANIISLVPAVELKKEHMVKLPVIVYNHQDKESVIESAIHLRERLDHLAKEQESKGGRYIRPIVLFQAQSKTKEDNTTFDKLKNMLIRVGIPAEEIKIKTANKDELKGIDLMSKDCKVKFIITINALKEGWDCPFAYILASLADKSSEVDVTQILGRVLRQPYVTKHSEALLNLSYVITASAKFHETLQNIIEGLKESGFSEKDYREHDIMPESEKTSEPARADKPVEMSFDVSRISYPSAQANDANDTVKEIEEIAIIQNTEMEKQIAESLEQEPLQIFQDLGIKTKQHKMRQEVVESAKQVKLPKFIFLSPDLSDLFSTGPAGELQLDRSTLLTGFKLHEKDISISFDSLSADLYKIDIEGTTNEDSKMSPFKLDNSPTQEKLLNHILSKPKEEQIKDIAHQLMQQIGKIYPIPDDYLRIYINRILEGMTPGQLRDFLVRKVSYATKIKEKIAGLADDHAEKQFDEFVFSNQVKTKPVWVFKPAIILEKTGNDIGKSLYVKEAEMNPLEQQFIMEVTRLSNIEFWHRNLERGKGFSLNGFKSNHYPDFILKTKKGTIVLAETKGSDRDNSDSSGKLKLGNTWANLSGENYKYFMIFEKNPPAGTYSIEKAVELISKM